MAGLRRPSSLISILGDVTTKIETLEARGTTTGSSVSSVTPSGNEDAGSAPGISSDTPLYLYKRVVKAFIYGSKVTGNTPRMELYFAEDPKVAQGAFVQIQGINGTSTDTWEEMSPAKYAVYATDTPPWDDGARADQDWRDTPTTGNNGQTVTHTIWFNPDIEVPITYSSTSGRELITTRRIDSVSATGSTVTVVFNSTHVFRVGDVISVDLEDELYGRDGLFKVSVVVDDNTIEYELETPLTSPISLSGSGLGTKYVYPVAHEYVEDGTIWNDTSVTPAKVYVWKEYRWYDTSDPVVAAPGAAAKDGIAPSPVTGLSASSTTIPGVNGQGGTAEITVSWTAPTTRSNGSPIDDYLGYYEIQYKRSTETEWTGKLEVAGTETSAIIRDPFIRLLTEYDIRVYVYDIMEQASVETSTTVTTTNFSETLNAPSKPTLVTRLGTITVNWDGLDNTGNSPVQGVKFVEVHYSTTNDFTPGPTTLYTTFPLTLQNNYAVVSGLTYNTTYYFKLRFVRSDGYSQETSAASAQESAMVAPLVDTDIINSTLDTWPFNGGVVPAGALASGAINAANLFGPNVITQNAISANAIGATQIAAGSIVAGKIAANAITASEIAANTISTGMLKANSIEADNIAAGAITASILQSKEIELKQSPTSTQRIVLNASGITAYNGGDTTFFIDGQSGSINAASITVSNITADNITTGTLSADRIAAESITAGKLEADLTMTKLIKTGAAGTDRIEIRGSTQANPGIVHVIGGVGAGNFRFYANGVSYLNNLELVNANLTGTLTASGTISGGTVSGATISGGTVSGSEVVGGTIRTSPSGSTNKRLIINSSGDLVFFDSGASSPTGTVNAGSSSLLLNGASRIALQIGGTDILNINSSGISLSPGETFNSNLPVSGNITATGSIQSDTFVRAAGGSGATLNSNGDITVPGVTRAQSTVTVGTMVGSTTNPIVRWSGAGAALTVGGTSDERIKDNIQPVENALDKINDINVITFTSKLTDENNEKRIGVIAQQIEQIDFDGVPFIFEMPTSGMTNLPEGFDSESLKLVNYEGFVPYLIKAVQELSIKNEALEARLAQLEGGN